MNESAIMRRDVSHLFRNKGPALKRIPYSFDFDLTARCNNDCNHCYINVPANDSQYKKRELSIDQIEKIADEAVSLGTIWCLLSGGEPFLREDFEEIYLLLKRKGLLISIFTNATLITESHVKLFKHYPPREIEITVYGTNPATYGKVTNRPDNYQAFIRGLHLLLDNKIPFRLKTMTLRSNIHEFSEIAAFCRKYTKDYFRFDPLLHLRYDRDPERNRKIMSERLTPEEIAIIDHAERTRSESLVKDCGIYIKDIDPARACNDGHLFVCGLGRNSFSLSFDGKFRLCASLCAPECQYDLKKGSLFEAWTEFAPRVLSMKTSNPDIIRDCLNCNIFNLCQWCPANAYLECGKLDCRPEYFCKVAHARSDALESKLDRHHP